MEVIAKHDPPSTFLSQRPFSALARSALADPTAPSRIRNEERINPPLRLGNPELLCSVQCNFGDDKADNLPCLSSFGYP